MTTQLIWATTESMPFSTNTINNAKAANAIEIIQIPCVTMPQLVAGINTVTIPPPPTNSFISTTIQLASLTNNGTKGSLIFINGMLTTATPST